MSVALSSIPCGNAIFPAHLYAGNRLVYGRFHTQDLRHFLSHDTGSDIFVRSYPVVRGQIHLNVNISHQNRMNYISGLEGYDEVYAMIREELTPARVQRKVIYGWTNAENWGNTRCEHLKYVLAEKKAGESSWRLFKDPRPIGGLNSRQRKLRENAVFNRALFHGLSARVLHLEWVVVRKEAGRNNYFVAYFTYPGRKVKIHGFNMCDQVYVRVAEKENKIIAYFYSSKEDEQSEKNLLKAAVLSEKIPSASGKARLWSPLENARVIFSTKASPQQYCCLSNGRLKEFLMSDRPEGDVFEFDPRHVYAQGNVGFNLDPSREDRGRVFIYGLTNYKGKNLPGKVVVQGDQKVAYLWINHKAMRSGLAPINPKGTALACRVRDDDKINWEIVWDSAAPGLRDKFDAAIKYGNRLYSNINDQVIEEHWPIAQINDAGKLRRQAYRKVRGVQMMVPIPDFIKGKRVFSAVRQIGGTIKLIEYWGNDRLYKQGADPFAARFITFRSKVDSWMAFWARLDDEKKFRRLLQQGHITKQQLDDIFMDDYLFSRYEFAMQQMIDALII